MINWDDLLGVFLTKSKWRSIILTAIMVATMVLPSGGTAPVLAQDHSWTAPQTAQSLSPNGIEFSDSLNEWETSDTVYDHQRIDLPDTNKDLVDFITEPATTGNLTGQVFLDGRTDYHGVTVIFGSRTATTDTQGKFEFNDIEAGTSNVLTASIPGFLSATHSSVQVNAGQTQTLSQITLPGGDANGDAKIDKLDLALISLHFNTVFASADINGDNTVDIYDLTLAGKNADKSGPIRWLPDSLLRWARLDQTTVDVGGTYDQEGALTPAVVKLSGGSFRMYYSGFDGSRYRILSATSSDLINWDK
jgi:hypothetical protein